jgi:hypothetical protein
VFAVSQLLRCEAQSPYDLRVLTQMICSQGPAGQGITAISQGLQKV